MISHSDKRGLKTMATVCVVIFVLFAAVVIDNYKDRRYLKAPASPSSGDALWAGWLVPCPYCGELFAKHTVDRSYKCPSCHTEFTCQIPYENSDKRIYNTTPVTPSP